MKKYTLDIEQAINLGMEQPFAYITRLSDVTVGITPGAFSMEDLLEARFFGPEQEVRIYITGDGFSAIQLANDELDEFLDISRPIRDPRFGKILTLRQYLDYDEDGQAYIRATRLLDWKGDDK